MRENQLILSGSLHHAQNELDHEGCRLSRGEVGVRKGHQPERPDAHNIEQNRH
jgi:hypothetical protein